MMNAASMPMGFLRSLYFEQVKKSVADAKEKEAKEQQQLLEQSKAPGYDRASQRMQQVNINRYNQRMRNNKQEQLRMQRQIRNQQNTINPAYSVEDLEEALEEME